MSVGFVDSWTNADALKYIMNSFFKVAEERLQQRKYKACKLHSKNFVTGPKFQLYLQFSTGSVLW